MLLPARVADFVPKGHLARAIKEVVFQMDLREIEKKYHKLGQKSYAPQLLLGILIYGYATGIRSGRKMAKACESDIAFMYLANMFQPDFRTINDFRKNNVELFKAYFLQVLLICKELGMVRVGTIAIDGTKTRANASSKRSKTKEEYEKWKEHLKKEVEQLMSQAEEIERKEEAEHRDEHGDELPESIRKKEVLISKIEEIIKTMNDEEKVNLTDRDAKFIKDKGEIKPNYCSVLAVTEDGIITSTNTINTANEGSELMKLVKETEEISEEKIEHVLADAQYGTFDNYEALQDLAYIPDQTVAKEQKKKYKDQLKEDKVYPKSKFRYDKENDHYVCPQNKVLSVRGKSNDQGRSYIDYKCSECQHCPVKHLCTTAKNREIKREVREHIKEEALERLKTEEGRKIYAKRGWMVETKFGHFKHNLKYRMFSLRGLTKVSGEFNLVCLANNLMKIYQWKMKLALAGV